MSAQSKIEWTDASWTPIRARNRKTGKVGWHCEHLSPGCVNCYAEGDNARFGTGLPFKPGHRGDVELFLDEKMLLAPLHWKHPRMVFVCSMTDLFADFVPDAWIDRIFAVMALAPQHTFQVLTKRAERMRRYLTNADRAGGAFSGLRSAGSTVVQRAQGYCADFVRLGKFQPGGFGPIYSEDWERAKPHLRTFPLPNVWLGVSTEDQRRADERIPHLLSTPAAVRFLSAEPLLGPLDLTKVCGNINVLGRGSCPSQRDANGYHSFLVPDGLDWVIVGGESRRRARPMNPQWARALRDQCEDAGVAFFFKQWGEFLPVGQTLPGFGKIHGATAVKPGRMKLHYGGSVQQPPQHAFAERGIGIATTEDGRLAFRVGKKAAGRLLDGVEYNGMPQVRP